MNKNKKQLRKQVYNLLDRYGLFQKVKMKEWDYGLRDNFFKSFLVLVERYAEKKERREHENKK